MTYIVSDIHGYFDLFLKLLDKINFSQDDELICCGDLIDKGPNSVKLIRFVKEQSNMHCILGNHEYSVLKDYYSMLQNSTVDFDEILQRLQTYFPDGKLDWDLIGWLETLPAFIERSDFICVHAGIPLGADGKLIPFDKTSVEQLVYDRRFKDADVIPKSDKTVFFGHTPSSYLINENKIITYRRKDSNTNLIKDFYKVHLDIGVWLHGRLGCFCVETCQEFYVE